MRSVIAAAALGSQSSCNMQQRQAFPKSQPPVACRLRHRIHKSLLLLDNMQLVCLLRTSLHSASLMGPGFRPSSSYSAPLQGEKTRRRAS